MIYVHVSGSDRTPPPQKFCNMPPALPVLELRSPCEQDSVQCTVNRAGQLYGAVHNKLTEGEDTLTTEKNGAFSTFSLTKNTAVHNSKSNLHIAEVHKTSERVLCSPSTSIRTTARPVVYSNHRYIRIIDYQSICRTVDMGEERVVC